MGRSVGTGVARRVSTSESLCASKASEVRVVYGGNSTCDTHKSSSASVCSVPIAPVSIPSFT